MAKVNRRCFLAISASAVAVGGNVHANTMRQWSGSGLGARMTITLDHPDGADIARKAFAEVNRLEDIFSLYRADSALSRLNANGYLEHPPFELLECLSLCSSVHRATKGLFDPTIQSLWELYAEAYSAGSIPNPGDVSDRLAQVDWGRVEVASSAVRLQGTKLTLNGIAQGFVADKVATLLKRQGLTEVLINTGEMVAMGGEWPVILDDGQQHLGERIQLSDQALASSAPLGTVFDRQARVGHILDPRTGLAAKPRWRMISLLAPSAALADGLTTAMVLMDKREIDALLSNYSEAKVSSMKSTSRD